MPHATGRTARMRKPNLAEMPVREVRGCDWPAGCSAQGEFRAPRGRDRLTEYFWFCLDHVRDYNASWNYYQGMSEGEIEADIRADTVWRRPSWPFLKALHRATFRPNALFDDLGGSAEATRSAEEQRWAGTPAGRALVVLELSPPVTVAAVKARYKVLVKKHHPDANGGAKAAEERFKQINEAYRIVLSALEP
ncbi:MAG: J domain-containing protein [Rhodospirillales bacterium]